jgi:hypothetical protein
MEKHEKYRYSYGRQEEFWGIGIEEETYIQFSKPVNVASHILHTAHKPERYSVRYFESYKPGYETAIRKLYDTSEKPFVPLPLFLNSHGLSKMDCDWQHKTTYEKVPQPNPQFDGLTLFERLQLWDYEYFRGHHEITFIFDGDSIEFMTQKFYKAKVKDVIKELINHKTTFLHKLNTYLQVHKLHMEKGSCIWPPVNPGFVIHYSNPLNVSMFNNGTYHINVTLPTMLGVKGEILFPEKFREDHRKFIRVIQWMQPFLVAEYGTPDPLSKVDDKYSKSSQRVAVSRYIGLGTFDTNTMAEGKRNTIPVTELAATQLPTWWYNRYHTTSGYVPLEEIGLDINYKKHFKHGCELRFFDWFPENKLQGLLEELVLFAEVSNIHSLAQEPQITLTWNNCVIGVMKEGYDFLLQSSTLATYEKVLGIPLMEKVGQSVKVVYLYIIQELRKRYKKGSIYKKLIL